jgi:peroxiredoxin
MMDDAGRAIQTMTEGEGMSVTVGEMAPQFSLPGTTGPGLDLPALRGKGRAALFFYPADRTAG